MWLGVGIRQQDVDPWIGDQRSKEGQVGEIRTGILGVRKGAVPVIKLPSKHLESVNQGVGSQCSTPATAPGNQDGSAKLPLVPDLQSPSVSRPRSPQNAPHQSSSPATSDSSRGHSTW